MEMETTKFTQSIWERNFPTDLDVITFIREMRKPVFDEFTRHIRTPELCKSIIADMIMASDMRLTVDTTVKLIQTGIDHKRGIIVLAVSDDMRTFKTLHFSMN